MGECEYCRKKAERQTNNKYYHKECWDFSDERCKNLQCTYCGVDCSDIVIECCAVGGSPNVMCSTCGSDNKWCEHGWCGNCSAEYTGYEHCHQK